VRLCREFLRNYKKEYKVFWISFVTQEGQNEDIKNFALTNGLLIQCINMQRRGYSKQPIFDKSPGIVANVRHNIAKQLVNKFGILCVIAQLGEIKFELAHATTLLIGIDVNHSKKEFKFNVESRKDSYVGMVAILIKEGEWYTYWDYHVVSPGIEVIGQTRKGSSIRDRTTTIQRESDSQHEVGEQAIKRFIKKLRLAFQSELNGKEIDYVFAFRDGVSRDQLVPCREFEVNQVIDAFAEPLTSNSSTVPKMPKIAYTVIQKDGIAKFLVTDRNGRVGSPFPGVVIAKDGILGTSNAFLLAHKEQKWNEFFLVSTHNTQSTAKPIHCFVIYDTTGWGSNDNSLQQLCFTLCHLYPNFCSSTRVPCVTRAAYRVAELMGRIHKSGTESDRVVIPDGLKKTYWYL